MNKYEELVYSLIYNCNRELTTEEKETLNQASAIYNTYNQLTEQLGCPLEVVIKALQYGVYYIHYELGKDDEMIIEKSFKLDFRQGIGWCLTKHKLSFSLKDYKNIFWLKKDKSE